MTGTKRDLVDALSRMLAARDEAERLEATKQPPGERVTDMTEDEFVRKFSDDA